MKRKPRPLVLIEWVDSCGLGNGPWHSVEACAALQPVTLLSVGWVLVDDAQRVVLFAHSNRRDQVSGEIVIPKSCVRQRWELKLPRGFVNSAA